MGSQPVDGARNGMNDETPEVAAGGEVRADVRLDRETV